MVKICCMVIKQILQMYRRASPFRFRPSIGIQITRSHQHTTATPARYWRKQEICHANVVWVLISPNSEFLVQSSEQKKPQQNIKSGKSKILLFCGLRWCSSPTRHWNLTIKIIAHLICHVLSLDAIISYDIYKNYYQARRIGTSANSALCTGTHRFQFTNAILSWIVQK